MTSYVITEGRLFIDGKWRAALDKQTAPTINPADGSEIAQIAQASEADADAAVDAARRAFDEGPWPRMSVHERARLLYRVADLVERDADEMAYRETVDMGKPIMFSSSVDVPIAIQLLRYYAGMATQLDGSTRGADTPTLNYTLRQPLGVVAAITPFNFPLLLALTKIAPALAAGNTVIHKPSPATPLTALKMAELFAEAGFPDGVMNVITGPGVELGETLSKHPRINKIAFTGSTEVGKAIIRNSADTLKKVTMELGGKSPHIIFADADLDAALEYAFFGIFYNKGEICTAGSRLLVERPIYDEVVQRLTDRAGSLLPGDPLDPATMFGPLAHQGQFDKVSSYVEVGVNEGARLTVGGRPYQRNGSASGLYFLPTIFADVDNRMRIAQEEIFGPVLSIIPFTTVEEAVQIANDTEYGLASGVHTRDLKKALTVAHAIHSGTTWINTYNKYDSTTPYGGFKSSGFGRECGPESMESYTQVKSIWVDIS
ncbi:aldehyde dehydrogenase family protein [Streptosporangium sp. KLBMP 9127]|nr:aldehyde dehydrogenase family protein [Streptosporangium sp. KLBMP 9127]